MALTELMKHALGRPAGSAGIRDENSVDVAGVVEAGGGRSFARMASQRSGRRSTIQPAAMRSTASLPAARHAPDERRRGLRSDRTAQTIIAGHAFVQTLRRGHYELATDAPSATRVAAAFTELARAI